MNCRRDVCISTAVLLALLSSGPVWCEEQSVGSTATGAPAGGTTESSTANSNSLEEVVVTALKRAENLQRTPAAVTAVSADTLTHLGITDLRAMEDVIPSARFLEEGYSTDPFIRGVGQSQGWAAFDPAVATNFNGVYVPRDATDVPVFDAERIEVLPGPQGTLYGRSAAGGAVNIISKRPTDRYEAEGIVEAGKYGLTHATAIGNVPVSNELSLRAAVDFNSRGGYQSTGDSAHQGTSARLSALWRFTSAFTAYLWGMHYQDTGAPGNLITIPFIKKDDPWYVVPAGQPGPAPYTSLVGPDGDNRARVTHDFVGGQIHWNVADSVTLSYIPGYTYANNDRFFTLGSVNAPGFNLAFEVNHRINQLTQCY